MPMAAIGIVTPEYAIRVRFVKSGLLMQCS